MSKLFQVYGLGQALIPVLPPPLHFLSPPTSSQDNYSIGQQVYVGTVGSYTFYIYNGAGVWEQLVGPSGSLDSLSNAFTKVFPDATGNIAIFGIVDQIQVNSLTNALQLTIPMLFVPPGDVTFLGGIDFTPTTSTFVDPGAAWEFDNTPLFTNGLTVSGGTTAFNAGFDVNTGTVNVAAPVSWNFLDVPQFNNGYVVTSGVVDITAGTSTTEIFSPIISIGQSPNPQISINSGFTLFSNDRSVAIATDLIGNNIEIGATADIANDSSTLISAGTRGIQFLSATVFETFHTVNSTVLDGLENTIACNVNTNPISVTLVAAPVDGTRLVIYDSDGKGALNNITITATGGFLFQGNGSFNGTATLTINQNYGSVELYFSNPAFATPFWLVASSNYTF